MVRSALTAISQHQTGWSAGLRAGFWRRFVAALIDGLIVAIPLGLLENCLARRPATCSGCSIAMAYFTYFEGGPAGQGYGKRAMGICVVDVDTGGPIGYPRGLIRYIGRGVSAIVFYLGYLWMLWDGQTAVLARQVRPRRGRSGQLVLTRSTARTSGRSPRA